MRRLIRSIVLVLVACEPRPSDTRVVAPTPVVSDAQAPASDPRPAVFDAAIAEMVDACRPVLETTGSTEPPRVADERVDLDGDGREEAIVNVSCEDLSQWKVLVDREGEAVVVHEQLATATSYRPVRGPDGGMLLIVEHDCCCMYELSVHAMDAGALQQRFAWSSGCAEGCDGSSAMPGDGDYVATVDVRDGRLHAINVPRGACGVDGSDEVDLRAWKLPE